MTEQTLYIAREIVAGFSNKQNTMKVATEILKQLGGGRFIAMTGATCISDDQTLIVNFKGSKVANIMYVTLTSLDLYDVKICKCRGMDAKTIKEVEGVYCDMLVPIFESTTGLRTKLFYK